VGDKAGAMKEYEILKGIAPFMAEQLLVQIKEQK
jgi:hypothetical protein